MNYMEQGNSRLRFARRRAAVNVWVTLLGSTMHFKNAGDEEIYLHVDGSRRLLTGLDWPDYTGYNDFENGKGGILSFPVLVSVTERLLLRVCPPHTLMYTARC